jgi:hypothetical protein
MVSLMHRVNLLQKEVMGYTHTTVSHNIAQHLQDIKASQHSTHTDASIRQTQPTPHNTENTSGPEQIFHKSAH